MKRVSILLPITTIIAAFALIASMIAFAWNFNQPKTLYTSDNVKVVKNGTKIAVTDVANQKEHTFKAKLKKHSDVKTAPKTAIDTENVKVTLLPGVGIEINDKKAGKIFTVKRSLFR